MNNAFKDHTSKEVNKRYWYLVDVLANDELSLYDALVNRENELFQQINSRIKVIREDIFTNFAVNRVKLDADIREKTAAMLVRSTLLQKIKLLKQEQNRNKRFLDFITEVVKTGSGIWASPFTAEEIELLNSYEELSYTQSELSMNTYYVTCGVVVNEENTKRVK